VSSGACRRCGADLAPSAGPRPRLYCGVGCRRSVEREATRVDRRLEQAECLRDRLQLDLELGGEPRLQRRRQEQLGRARVEVERLELRLRELLDDGRLDDAEAAS
jgi:bacterioferritin (cytochrome b1)